MNKFILHSKFQPAGDQPEAIKSLVEGINDGKQHQVLLGVTGSGKTFTIANVIEKLNRPTLIISHNKTLASQLYSELKEFFPENRVEYFISYFDFYKPEAYIPTADLYIEKTAKNNKELEAMRMSAINALTIRKDTIVVASVAAIYGEFNPYEYRANFFDIEVGMKVDRRFILNKLNMIGYSRNDVELNIGELSVKGDTIYIAPGYTTDFWIRIEMFDDEIEAISKINPTTRDILEKGKVNNITVFPATTYTVNMNRKREMISEIKEELEERIAYFKSENKLIEAQRIKERVLNDLDSIQEFGYTSGMENYARYLDGRKPGERPYTIFDYLPHDAMIFIDESHMMIPQLNGMFNGDRSRKETLVEYGFRLPSALDNRPLRFHEFEEFHFPKIYLSATPGEYELNKTEGEVVTQYIRPTGLLDPIIEVNQTEYVVFDIFEKIQQQIKKKERTLILTTTKKRAEELSTYFKERKIKSAYIHDQFKIFERNEILRGLRSGKFDVVIGINLLREGIDLPEVSLVCILDADSHGFMRNTRSLIQIVGRAARNDHGKVIFYAQNFTEAMVETIQDNENKRKIQQEYNEKHGIVPKTIIKDIPKPISGIKFEDVLDDAEGKVYNRKYIKRLVREMNQASKERNFEKAIEIRDHLFEIGIDLEEFKSDKHNSDNKKS
ncbi:excinuclease ABC subunit B [Metamycoplasma subdolum]|uniref:UvrABC system protein B n=1 Tax=Metamycoplasma subdolum TaxID=92407 RepID=A0A3L9ZY92_9BACT|nr:excinuclease ABC subunit UvrB [Metamycoplasma subdolum]RMA77410.1 excinuclease ABC subunit B [Metamycoplasma subdolum]WPB50491.1 excinuclease ABC subunit UvrB [Metamycoplasma subdolum]